MSGNITRKTSGISFQEKQSTGSWNELFKITQALEVKPGREPSPPQHIGFTEISLPLHAFCIHSYQLSHPVSQMSSWKKSMTEARRNAEIG